jgi:hypothetical protein
VHSSSADAPGRGSVATSSLASIHVSLRGRNTPGSLTSRT